jgi:hypothetical protein
MNIILYIAMGLTALTAGIGIAAIANAVRLNKEKHGEISSSHPKQPAATV